MNQDHIDRLYGELNAARARADGLAVKLMRTMPRNPGEVRPPEVEAAYFAELRNQYAAEAKKITELEAEIERAKYESATAAPGHRIADSVLEHRLTIDSKIDETFDRLRQLLIERAATAGPLATELQRRSGSAQYVAILALAEGRNALIGAMPQEIIDAFGGFVAALVPKVRRPLADAEREQFGGISVSEPAPASARLNRIRKTG